VLVVGYLIGAGTGLLAVVSVPTDHGNVGLVAMSIAAAGVAVVLALGRGLPNWAIKFFGIEATIVFVSLAVAFARPVGPAALYYLWPALDCGYFGTRRDVRVAAVLMCVSFAVALLFAHGVQVPVITYTTVVSVFLFALVLVERQAERTDRLLGQLAHAAATDSLTGLLDRRAFSQAFAREVERARASGLALCFIFLDLDHFKAVNDTSGHAAGDEALCAFARILERECSVTDLLARMGGEEFGIVLFDADAEIAGGFLQRVALALASWSEDHPRPLTTSAGIAMLSDETATPSQLLTEADRALYAAKAAGRNRVVASGQATARVLVAA
jgi:diguanylate cyclase (GGDEF)-like protein